MYAAVSAARLSSSTVVTPWYTPEITYNIAHEHVYTLYAIKVVKGDKYLLGNGNRIDIVHIKAITKLVDSGGNLRRRHQCDASIFLRV